MKTNFSPLTHGYYFANRFEFKGISRIIKWVKSNFIYGMCGGMVFSALDYYFDQNKIPDFKNSSILPLNYTKYLWKRQTESVSISVLLKIIYFSTISSVLSQRQSVKKELPLILDKIQDNLPAPIVIIRSNILQNPTHNHQVLVYGYEQMDNIIHFSLYDPNHPQSNPTLNVNMIAPFIITQSTGEPVRGFFLNNYQYKISGDLREL